MDEKARMETVKCIIEEHTERFISAIKDKTDITSSIRAYKSDFPIFHPANEHYFEYKMAEDLLERYIREHLVTDILCSLLSDKSVSPDTTIFVAQKKRKVAHLSRYDNAKFGDEYLFAFILQTKNERIGYRYSSICLDEKELPKLLKKYAINHIEIIDWSDTDELDSKKIERGVCEEQQDKVFYVTLHRFILTYLSEEIYQYYLSSVRDAVQEANNIIGFQTIPALSLRYVSDFKADFLRRIAKSSLRELKYYVFDETGHLTCETKKLLIEGDYDILDCRFFTNGLYKSLVGREDFAKCFITSEYLYSIFETGEAVSFDYSAVATGYFKSVELLLDKIKDIWLEYPETYKGLWIQGGNPALANNKDIHWCRFNPAPKANGTQVLFEPAYKDYFRTEMGSLIWLIHDNPNGWIVENNQDIIHYCLLNYSKGCRNEHLHKDIIDDREVLKAVRENTILCLYFLLGGCHLPDSLLEDATTLSLEDDSFERLYKKVKSIPRSVTNYYIQFGQSTQIKAFRLDEQDETTYDNSGRIISPIRFVLVDDFSDMRFETNEEYLELARTKEKLEISRQNMPERIWWYTSKKGKVEIEW